MQQRMVIGALLLIGFVSGGVLWRVITKPAPRAPTKADPSHEVPPGSQPVNVQVPAAPPGEAAPPPASGAIAKRQPPEGQRRAFDRVRADAVRQRAASQRAARLTQKAPLTVPSASPPPETTPEEEERRRLYIRDAVREQYFPIARSCYAELLEREPKAEGKVVLSFAVVGDGEDGVVDRVEFDDETTMDDAEFALCMRESMYSTIFEPPPPGTEETTVVYPIAFAPDDSTPPQNPGNVKQTSR